MFIPAKAIMKTRSMTVQEWTGSRSSGKKYSFKKLNLLLTFEHGPPSFWTMNESSLTRLCCTMSLQPLPNSITISPHAFTNPCTWSFKLSDSPSGEFPAKVNSDPLDSNWPVLYRNPVSSTRLASSSLHDRDPLTSDISTSKNDVVTAAKASTPKHHHRNQKAVSKETGLWLL